MSSASFRPARLLTLVALIALLLAGCSGYSGSEFPGEATQAPAESPPPPGLKSNPALPQSQRPAPSSP